MTFTNISKPSSNFTNIPELYNFLYTEDQQIITTETGEEIIIEIINSNWVNQTKPI